jgi:MFS family permease
MLGLVNFVALLPVLPVSLLAGVLSDRFPRRRLILLSEMVLMLQAFTMAVLLWLDIVEVWHVMVLSFIQGAASAIEQPARLAFVVDVVGKEDLNNAVALNSAGNNAGRILGPALGGLIIAAYGEAACFLINSISYLAVILALLAIHLKEQPRIHAPMRVMGSLKDGFQYMLGSKIILGLLFIVSIASFLTLPYIALMPVFARDNLQLGPDALGFLLTAVGIGAILGGLLVANLRSGKRGTWLLIANIIAPIFLIVFCYSQIYWVSLLLVTLVGASNAIRLTLATSLIQLNTADEYHGRVMSVFNLLFSGMSRAGTLVIGGMAEIVSVSLALGVGGLVSAVLGLAVLFKMNDVRRLE